MTAARESEGPTSANRCALRSAVAVAERLIGSIRRESLDHLVVFDEAQLRRVLKNYASYYNQVRPGPDTSLIE
jgi:hypothetical protein